MNKHQSLCNFRYQSSLISESDGIGLADQIQSLSIFDVTKSVRVAVIESVYELQSTKVMNYLR